MSHHQSSEISEWVPPQKIEQVFGNAEGSKFSSINSPTAGPRVEKDVPSGQASIQLYSLATPNGQKVSILLEELGVDYDAHLVNIGSGEQFTTGFVAINPNSKIPAAVDMDGADGLPVNLFESGSIVWYFAEKFNKFLPSNPRLKAEVMNWVQWQMAGQGPITGNFGHFMVYAPADKIETRNYGVARYGMEVQRLCSVLDRHLEGRTYMVGEQYTIADIVIFPWFNQLLNFQHTSGISGAEFLTMSQYTNANAWAKRISERPAVQRGLTVCKWGQAVKPWLEKEAKL